MMDGLDPFWMTMRENRSLKRSARGPAGDVRMYARLYELGVLAFAAVAAAAVVAVYFLDFP